MRFGQIHVEYDFQKTADTKSSDNSSAFDSWRPGRGNKIHANQKVVPVKDDRHVNAERIPHKPEITHRAIQSYVSQFEGNFQYEQKRNKALYVVNVVQKIFRSLYFAAPIVDLMYLFGAKMARVDVFNAYK